MRSAHDHSDLTTRARIRDHAIALIGEHGFAKASVRMIAKEAGVSPALVLHHFGDKDGLREACSAHVVAMFVVDGGADGAQPTIDAVRAAMDDLDAYGPALDYLARMLSDDGSASADDLFDSLLSGTLRGLEQQERQGLIHPQTDPESTALLLTLFGLAPLVLRRQFARASGEESLTPAVLARIAVPMLELFTRGLYLDDSMLNAVEGADPERNGPDEEDE